MKRLLIAAACLLLLQVACSLPAALVAAGSTALTQTAAVPMSGPAVLDTPGASLAQSGQPTATEAAQAVATQPDNAPAATPDPRIALLLTELRVYLATNPHIQKVDGLELNGSVLNLEITTVYPGKSDQAGVAYETAKAIAGGLSLVPKDQVDALMKSGRGTLHMRVNSSDAAWHFVSDTSLAVLAGLQAGQVTQDVWKAASHYTAAP
jgi:hypothetical protein